MHRSISVEAFLVLRPCVLLVRSQRLQGHIGAQVLTSRCGFANDLEAHKEGTHTVQEVALCRFGESGKALAEQGGEEVTCSGLGVGAKLAMPLFGGAESVDGGGTG
ncbi:hypothetical protein EGU54_00165 [Achromobacter aegrifaciens]|nr:hypothetical protein EGU54_00165 [Achromobacter aegrifaciens]